MKLKVDEVVFAPELNPRPEMERSEVDALAASFLTMGQLKPIDVVRREDQWHVSDGWRRVLAAKQLEWEEIEASEVPDDGKRHLVNLADVIQRQALSPIEEAMGVRREIEKGMSATALANSLGKSVKWVNSRLDMAKLTDVVKEREQLKEHTPSKLSALTKVSKKARPEAVKEFSDKARELTPSQTRKAAKILEKTPATPVEEAVEKAKETPGGGLVKLTVRLPTKIMDVLEGIASRFSMKVDHYVRFVVERDVAGQLALMKGMGFEPGD